MGAHVAVSWASVSLAVQWGDGVRSSRDCSGWTLWANLCRACGPGTHRCDFMSLVTHQGCPQPYSTAKRISSRPHLQLRAPPARLHRLNLQGLSGVSAPDSLTRILPEARPGGPGREEDQRLREMESLSHEWQHGPGTVSAIPPLKTARGCESPWGEVAQGG